jgi:hypothetical protein
MSRYDSVFAEGRGRYDDVFDEGPSLIEQVAGPGRGPLNLESNVLSSPPLQPGLEKADPGRFIPSSLYSPETREDYGLGKAFTVPANVIDRAAMGIKSGVGGLVEAAGAERLGREMQAEAAPVLQYDWKNAGPVESAFYDAAPSIGSMALGMTNPLLGGLLMAGQVMGAPSKWNLPMETRLLSAGAQGAEEYLGTIPEFAILQSSMPATLKSALVPAAMIVSNLFEEAVQGETEAAIERGEAFSAERAYKTAVDAIPATLVMAGMGGMIPYAQKMADPVFKKIQARTPSGRARLFAEEMDSIIKDTRLTGPVSIPVTSRQAPKPPTVEEVRDAFVRDMEARRNKAAEDITSLDLDTRDGQIGSVDAYANYLKGVIDDFHKIKATAEGIELSIDDILDPAQGVRGPREETSGVRGEGTSEAQLGAAVANMKHPPTVEELTPIAEKFTAQASVGQAGQDWYEESAMEIAKVFGGDTVSAEKFIQFIAITSPNAEVKANLTLATKAWDQYAHGESIRVGTEMVNDKLNELAYHGADWVGLKTNTFYTNLIEALRGHDSGFATMDLHMARSAFGKDKLTPREYLILERVTQAVAADLGVRPRQVQARIWVTQKASTIEARWLEQGKHKGLTPEQRHDMAFQQAVVNYGAELKRRGWLPGITPRTEVPSSSTRAGSRTITAEAVPSPATGMSGILGAEKATQKAFTKAVQAKVSVQEIGKVFGIDPKLISVDYGSGGYGGGITPNMIVRVAPADGVAMTQEEQERADVLALGLMYVYTQNSVPWFRADPNLEAGQTINGHDVSLGISVKWDGMTPAKESAAFAELRAQLGEDIGYTRVDDNTIAILNYSYMGIGNEDFANGVRNFAEKTNGRVEGQFGAESDYPSEHDWAADPSGKGILERIAQATGGSPSVQAGVKSLRQRAQAFYGAENAEIPLREDAREQAAWLKKQAVKNGFKSVDEMANKSEGMFLALAAEWRKKHPLRDPGQALGADAAEYLARKRAEAVKNLDAFKATLQQMASEVGGRALLPPPGLEIKSLPRATAKVEREYAGDPTRILDLLRGSVLIDTPVDMQKAITRLREQNIIKFKDFITKPTALGYAATIAVVDFNGVAGEVQLVPTQIQAVKDRIHKHYERLQDLDRTPRKTGGMLAEMEELMAYMVGEFAPALSDWNSSSEISAASMPMEENSTGRPSGTSNAVQSNPTQDTGVSIQSKNFSSGMSVSYQGVTGGLSYQTMYNLKPGTEAYGGKLSVSVPQVMVDRGWLWPMKGAEHQQAVRVALADLVAAGLPVGMVNNVSAWGWYDKKLPNNAKCYPGERVVAIREDVLEKSGSEMRSYIAHELSHLLDMKANTPDGSISNAPDSRLLPGGDMRVELEAVYAGDGVLADYLAYPLGAGMYQAANQTELFAQASAAYFNAPDVLRTEAPITYAAMEAIYGNGGDRLSVPDLISRVSETLRADPETVSRAHRGNELAASEQAVAKEPTGRGATSAGRADGRSGVLLNDASDAFADVAPVKVETAERGDTAQGVSTVDELSEKFSFALMGKVNANVQTRAQQVLDAAEQDWEIAKRGVVSHGSSEKQAEALAARMGWSADSVIDVLDKAAGDTPPVEILGASIAAARVRAADLLDAKTADEFVATAKDVVNLMTAARAYASEIGRALGYLGWLERKGGYAASGSGQKGNVPPKQVQGQQQPQQPQQPQTPGQVATRMAQARASVKGATAVANNPKVNEHGLTDAEMLEALGGTKGVQELMRILAAQGKNLDINMVAEFLSGMAAEIVANKNLDHGLLWKISAAHVELWRANILTGLFTHEVNVSSNAANMALEMLVVNPLKEVLPGGAGMKGYIQAVRGLGGFRKLIADIWAVGKYAAMDEVKWRQLAHLTQQHDSDLKALMRGSEGSKWTDTKRRAIPGTFGKVVRTVGFVPLGVEDALFKVIPFRYELARQQAAGEAKDLQKAIDYSAKLTFQESAGKIGLAVKWLHDAFPHSEMWVTFVKTMTNLIKRGADLTPGLSQAKNWQALVGKKGNEAMREAYSLSIVSTGIAALVLGLMGDDDDEVQLTGYAPTDRYKRLLFLEEHDSIGLRVGDTLFPLYRFSPLAEPAGMVVGMHDSIKSGTVAPFMNSVSQAFLSKHFVQNIAEVVDAMMEVGRERADPDYLDKVLRRQLGGIATGTVLPNMVAQIADMSDPYKRETKTVLDDFQKRIPMLREELPVKLRINGSALPEPRYMSPYPIQPRKVKKDEVSRWLMSIGKGIDPEPRSIKTLPSDVKQQLLKERWSLLADAKVYSEGLSKEDQRKVAERVLRRWGGYVSDIKEMGVADALPAN